MQPTCFDASPADPVCPAPCPQVRGLWWSSDDAALVTAGVDGAVYEWRPLEGRRARDFVQKGWAYAALVGGGRGGAVGEVLVSGGLLC